MQKGDILIVSFLVLEKKFFIELLNLLKSCGIIS